MHKSVQEIIEQWKITLADAEKASEDFETVYMPVCLSDVQTVTKYFDDIDTFKQSL